MPKILTELSVLVSCPNDLAQEKKIVKAAVDETNVWLRDSYGIVLKVLDWEDDVVPGIGADPQSVINSQIEGRYDIYLGLLGTRFGTRTLRAGSGTEEEFNDALDKYARAPETVRVLFYFKTSVSDVHKIDVDQLKRAIDFRNRISQISIFAEFSNSDELLRMLKDHLRTLIVEQWGHEKWKILTPIQQPRGQELAQFERAAETAGLTGAEGDPDKDDRKAAILDAIVSGEDNFVQALEPLSRVIDLMQILTERINARTASLSPNLSARDMKAVIDGAADDLTDYNVGLKREVPALTLNMGTGLDSLDGAIDIFLSERLGTTDQLRSLRQNLSILGAQLITSRTKIDDFREVIATLPTYTVKFRKARNLTVRLLANLSASLTIFLDKANSIVLKLPSSSEG